MALADRIFGRPKINSSRTTPQGLLSRRQRSFKRLFDATVASATLVAVSPLILVTAVLVRATSRGPAFYRHRRVGRNGTMFNVLKFRTMYVSEAEVGWQITVGGDSRITPVGRWLRSTKIDEVPQLWNVLRGEMSLVGWRPHVAGYPDKLTGPDTVLIDERPGITGAATLYFRDEERLLSRQTDPRRYYDEVIYPAKVRMDLAYFRKWSLRRDIYCLLVTSLPFTDRWAQVVPTETLPEQLPGTAPAADRTIDSHAPSARVPSDGFRPAVAVPVWSNGSGTAPNGIANANTNGNGHRPAVAVPVRSNGNGHRRAVAVPVRSNGHAASEPTDLGEGVTNKPPTVIPVSRPSVDTAAEEVRLQ